MNFSCYLSPHIHIHEVTMLLNSPFSQKMSQFLENDNGYRGLLSWESGIKGRNYCYIIFYILLDENVDEITRVLAIEHGSLAIL